MSKFTDGIIIGMVASEVADNASPKTRAAIYGFAKGIRLGIILLLAVGAIWAYYTWQDAQAEQAWDDQNTALYGQCTDAVYAQYGTDDAGNPDLNAALQKCNTDSQDRQAAHEANR